MAVPVNRPAITGAPAVGADARLYLRDQDLDQGAALIQQAARRLLRLARSGVGKTEISEAELAILLELHDSGPLDVGLLRTRLGSPKQSLARNLNDLETRGLLARETSARDRRRRLVKLTDEGGTLALRAAERRRAALREAFLSAGQDAVNGARRVLSELVRERDR
jgi:DNA-binding MarR family transcriptional regulator